MKLSNFGEKMACIAHFRHMQLTCTYIVKFFFFLGGAWASFGGLEPPKPPPPPLEPRLDDSLTILNLHLNTKLLIYFNNYIASLNAINVMTDCDGFHILEISNIYVLELHLYVIIERYHNILEPISIHSDSEFH